MSMQSKIDLANQLKKKKPSDPLYDSHRGSQKKMKLHTHSASGLPLAKTRNDNPDKKEAIKMVEQELFKQLKDKEKKERKDHSNFKMKKINSKIIVSPNESSNMLSSAVRKSKGRNQSKKQNISVDGDKDSIGKSGILILSK